MTISPLGVIQFVGFVCVPSVMLAPPGSLRLIGPSMLESQLLRVTKISE